MHILSGENTSLSDYITVHKIGHMPCYICKINMSASINQQLTLLIVNQDFHHARCDIILELYLSEASMDIIYINIYTETGITAKLRAPLL